MPAVAMSPLEMPVPPATLKASDADLQGLRDLVQRVGWHEALYRVCELLAEEYNRLPDCTKKGSMKMVCNSLSMVVPSAHWIDKPLVLHWPESKTPDGGNDE